MVKKMAKTSSSFFLLVAMVAAAVTATGSTTILKIYDERNVEAYHFHTYFFDFNPHRAEEAMKFRRATRARIQNGFLEGCSLNEVMIGVDGPHPFSQYELCCNATSFPQATAWYMRNHGNLSILIHPLTTEDLDDHKQSRIMWLGQPVPLDTECPFLYPFLPKPRPCPVYPEYPDEIPSTRGSHFSKIPGTEDYQNRTGLNLLYDKY